MSSFEFRINLSYFLLAIILKEQFKQIRVYT